MDVYCCKCGAKNHNLIFCYSCGEKLVTLDTADRRVYEVMCPWCGGVTKDIAAVKCESCGGPLPLYAGSKGLCERPPKSPRKIPDAYIKKLKYENNTLYQIGIIFIVAFFWTIIFLLIGIFLVRYSKKISDKKIVALKYGTPTIGEILSVEYDYETTLNGKHPWKITYVFKTLQGEEIVAEKNDAWDISNRYIASGDKVWVVYIEIDPTNSAIWPPIS